MKATGKNNNVSANAAFKSTSKREAFDLSAKANPAPCKYIMQRAPYTSILLSSLWKSNNTSIYEPIFFSKRKIEGPKLENLNFSYSLIHNSCVVVFMEISK